ncbi:hypothetical protein [Neisseria perflava]|uniref:hypothetical protein n=1 Tax=Neisseria perflava TaxID=33053 RepID=UPI0020A1DF6E|nr:hypothetical protein [Neisseria perflava]MCP1660784.1 hypothetical protein [Neisseria perflava]MCP1773299.1 hypothetical protein [Neisseria perflava]
MNDFHSNIFNNDVMYFIHAYLNNSYFLLKEQIIGLILKVNNYINNSGIDMAIIISLLSFFVSIFAVYISKKQADISKKQFTLEYINMENNDNELIKARHWLHNLENSIGYIKAFASKDSFLAYKNNNENRVFGFKNKEEVQEYVDGVNYLNKIIISRQIASEAIILNMLDEDTYWLIRNGDFSKDYRKLEDFIKEQHKEKSYNPSFDRKAFRIVVHKWQNSEIRDINAKMRKRKWSRYWKQV